ncbi:XdhC family protein [Phyllobacterium sp. YR531]|uniref:XdhC family protein n=1 Tax=Phyllobacterium sp. YR531 TaxID=1144343 RepID=UPI0002E12A48|nr:XdhC family protein [Phyllobacterium sp. YR531]
MDPYCLKKLNEERRQRRAVIMLTDLEDGRDRVIRETDPVAGSLGNVIKKAFLTGRSGVAEVEGRSFFLNVYLPSPRLVVIGAVHISEALAPMAKIAGFEMEIIDPRTAFATRERFPDVNVYADWPDGVLQERPLDAYCALAVLSHDPKIDDPALAAALNAGCFYIGALGSRTTHAKRVERLKLLGFNKDQTDSINAPIGLDIGAVGPQEIAVAIIGGIIKSFRSRDNLHKDMN